MKKHSPLFSEDTILKKLFRLLPWGSDVKQSSAPVEQLNPLTITFRLVAPPITSVSAALPRFANVSLSPSQAHNTEDKHASWAAGTSKRQLRRDNHALEKKLPLEKMLQKFHG